MWSYNEDYDTAWIFSGACLSGALAAADTSMFFDASSQSPNPLGDASKIKTLDLVKIEDEFIYIKGENTELGASIAKGMNGTTSASHAASTAIYTWEPEIDVEYAATELAAFQYLSSKSPRTGRIAIPGLGGFSIDIPDSWPPQTLDKLGRYKKGRVYSI